MGLQQTKKFLHKKGNTLQSRKQPTEQKKIFTHYTIDKVLISRMYKELQKHSNKENIPVKKWTKNDKTLFTGTKLNG